MSVIVSGGSKIWRGEVRPFSSPPLPSPFPSPSLPSPFLPLPFPPFPFLSLPRPYPFPPSPPLRSRTPWLRLGGLEERYKLPQRVRAERGRQTLSGAFSAYLGAFWQAFSSNLSLVKLQLLAPPQDFSFQKCDASAEAYLIPSPNLPSHPSLPFLTLHLPLRVPLFSPPFPSLSIIVVYK